MPKKVIKISKEDGKVFAKQSQQTDIVVPSKIVKKTRGILFWATVQIIGGLILAGIVGGIVWHLNSRAKAQRLMEAKELVDIKEEAARKVERIEKVALDVASIAEKAKPFGPEVSNAVLVVTGEPMDKKPQMLRVRIERKGEKQEVSIKRLDEERKEIKEEENIEMQQKVIVDEVGREAPEGLDFAPPPPVSKKSSSSEVKSDTERVMEANEKNKDIKKDTEEEGKKSDEPAIKVTAKRVIELINILQANASMCHDSARIGREVLRDTMGAPTARLARKSAEGLDPLLAKVEDLCKESADSLEEVRREYEKVIQMKKEYEEWKKEQERIAEIRRKEEEHKKMVAAEKERIKSCIDYCEKLLRDMKFENAVENFEKVFDNLQTEEAKKEMITYKDKYVMVLSFKKELVSMLRKEPFPWGWGESTTAMDIVNGDDNGIVLKTGKHIEWKDIPAKYMDRIIMNYICPEKVKIAKLPALWLGAAIFFELRNEHEYVDNYVQRAKKMDPAIQDLILRVLGQSNQSK